MLNRRTMTISLAVISAVAAGAGLSCRRDATSESTAAPPERPVRSPADRNASQTSNEPEADQPDDDAIRPTRTGEREASAADPQSSPGSGDDRDATGARKQKRTRPAGEGSPEDNARGTAKDKSTGAKSGRGNDVASAPPEPNVEFTNIPPWTRWEPANAGEKLFMGFVLDTDERNREAAKMTGTQTAAGEGRVQTVIDRLVEKFATSPPPTIKRAQLTASGLPITLVDIVGVYQPGEGKQSRPDYRIFCALIENGEWVTVVKVVGPDDAIQENQSAILDMIRSARPR